MLVMLLILVIIAANLRIGDYQVLCSDFIEDGCENENRGTAMTFTQYYVSPLGVILLAADEIGLTGLWFDGGKYYADNLPAEQTEQDTPVLAQTKHWLDVYFTGKEPDFLPPLHPAGSAFRQEVWKILLQIPYGKTTTYGEIARQIAKKQGLTRMSAQAVGGAVGHNAISIIIPCHRVVGTNGSLTGYAGGMDKKIKLLELEHTDMTGFFVQGRAHEKSCSKIIADGL